MERIETGRHGDTELAMKILSWIFHAQRALHMNELVEALVVTVGDQELERQYLLQPTDVIECCKSLVLPEKQSGLVRFAHYTVQEYVAGIQEKLPPPINLAKTCLTYLAFKEFDHPFIEKGLMETRVEQYQFCRYAAQFWGVHTFGEAEQSPDIQQDILRLFASEDRRNAILQIETFANSKWGNICFTAGETILHIMARFGLATMCDLITINGG
jgi:hypothetical protein